MFPPIDICECHFFNFKEEIEPEQAVPDADLICDALVTDEMIAVEEALALEREAADAAVSAAVAPAPAPQFQLLQSLLSKAETYTSFVLRDMHSEMNEVNCGAIFRH